MSHQERRFGSPEYAVRGNSMMFDLPTSNLDDVNPGVEVIGGSKPLKGKKYDEDPNHELEVEESEQEEPSSFGEIEELFEKHAHSAAPYGASSEMGAQNNSSNQIHESKNSKKIIENDESVSSYSTENNSK